MINLHAFRISRLGTNQTDYRPIYQGNASCDVNIEMYDFWIVRIDKYVGSCYTSFRLIVSVKVNVNRHPRQINTLVIVSISWAIEG